ncbi:hypothetical protein ACWCXH_34330 [Kitasatospora sp. NPDC001660]
MATDQKALTDLSTDGEKLRSNPGQAPWRTTSSGVLRSVAVPPPTAGVWMLRQADLVERELLGRDVVPGMWPTS